MIDLLGGRVVHAVGGRRHEYQPVVSRLTASGDPADLALVLVVSCSARGIYVADLDAILGTGSNSGVVSGLAARLGLAIYCDVGLHGAADFDRVPAGADVVPVLGTETVAGPGVLAAAGRTLPRFAVSVDLSAGRLLGDWPGFDVVTLAAAAGAAGAELVVLLDLASVGEGRGPAALKHCREVRSALGPTVRLAVGGGVRDRDDLERLAEAGADAALVATALHAGVLP